MSYKRGQDTYQDWREESAAPYAPDQSFSHDPNPNASWGATGDMAVHLTTWDTRLDANGHSLTTRAKAGPANSSSQEAGGGI